jgi:CelD/BcsL family acetyltransferase involved in cellulose biosynthesis
VNSVTGTWGEPQGAAATAMNVCVSTDSVDSAWDAFLRSTALGEFPQSSIWARYKQVDGWESSRTLLKRGQRIVGGFQVLWRKTRFGRIGYVSKGPVAEAEAPELLDALVGLLTRTARQLRLAGMVVQPPGRSRLTASRLPTASFAANRIQGIVTATLVVDVSGGMPAVEARMRRTTRQLLRKSIRSGVRLREGSEKDLETFYHLMLKTCERQNVLPNPSSAAALKALWKASDGAGGCRLTFAEQGGKAIGGLFCIAFGEVLTLWKKGSLPEMLTLHPMELLYHDAFGWANSRGFRFCDFLSLQRRTAECLLKRLPLEEEQKHSRDIFNLGFGGAPVLLPEAYLHFPNPVLSAGYRLLTRNEWTMRWLKKAARKLEGG